MVLIKRLVMCVIDHCTTDFQYRAASNYRNYRQSSKQQHGQYIPPVCVV